MQNSDKFFRTTCDIVQAAYNVLQIKGSKKITVTDICKSLDINRSTFYAHFKDIDEVLSLINFDLLEITNNLFGGKYSVNLDTVTRVFSIFESKRDFFEKYYCFDCVLDFRPIFRGIYIHVPEREREFLAELWSATSNDFIKHWMLEDKEKDASYMASCFVRDFLPSIRKFHKEVE